MSRGSLSLAHADGPTCDAQHNSFHLGKNYVRPTSHLLRMSHIRNSVRPTFHLIRIFHIWPDAGWERRAIQFPRSDMSGSSDSAYLESIRSQQFIFPGQLSSSNTRDSSDLFPPTIKKQTPIILTTKSLELSFSLCFILICFFYE